MLRRLGCSAAMLPLLHTEKAAWAQGPAGFPKRYVQIIRSNGVAPPQFYPSGDDPTASEALSPLAPWKSKVLLPVGVNYQAMIDNGSGGKGHASYPTAFTGYFQGNGPSLDQVLADKIGNQVKLAMPLINVFIRGDYAGPASWRSGRVRARGESNPAKLFDLLFSGASLPTEQIDLLRLRRRSVLDYLGKELEAFGTRLGVEDKVKIAEHMQSVRQLEKQLVAPVPAAGGGSCKSPTLAAVSFGDINNYPAQLKAMGEITAVAMRCDLTRVAHMSWEDDGGSNPSSFPFLSGNPNNHGVAHAGAGQYGTKVRIDRFYVEMLAHMVKLFAETPEAGGSMLDNTVINFTNGMNRGEAHGVGGVPWVMVGTCGGYFRTGRVVRTGGISNNRILASCSNAMGFPAGGFGDPKYGGTADSVLR
jgi:hypothetical protein